MKKTLHPLYLVALIVVTVFSLLSVSVEGQVVLPKVGPYDQTAGGDIVVDSVTSDYVYIDEANSGARLRSRDNPATNTGFGIAVGGVQPEIIANNIRVAYFGSANISIFESAGAALLLTGGAVTLAGDTTVTGDILPGASGVYDLGVYSSNVFAQMHTQSLTVKGGGASGVSIDFNRDGVSLGPVPLSFSPGSDAAVPDVSFWRSGVGEISLAVGGETGSGGDFKLNDLTTTGEIIVPDTGSNASIRGTTSATGGIGITASGQIDFMGATGRRGFLSDNNISFFETGGSSIGLNAGVVTLTGDVDVTGTLSAGDTVEASSTGFPTDLVLGNLGAFPGIAASTSNIWIRSQGSVVNLQGNGAAGNLIMAGVADASAANYFEIRSKAAGSEPAITALGSDTDIDIELVPKGAGVVKLSDLTATGTTTIGAGTKSDGLVRQGVSEVQTLAAAQTTLATVALLDENTYNIHATVIGVKSDGTARASYDLIVTVYRTAAGSATIQGAVTTVHSAESDAAWDATVTVSGNNALVSVTGVAATTIEWGGTIESLNMSN